MKLRKIRRLAHKKLKNRSWWNKPFAHGGLFMPIKFSKALVARLMA